MIIVSDAYRDVMSRLARNKGHVKVTYGISNANEVLATSYGIPNDFTNGGAFTEKARGQIYKCSVNYAYLGVNSMRTNGTQIILPKDSSQFQDNGYVPNIFSAETPTTLTDSEGKTFQAYQMESGTSIIITNPDRTKPLNSTGFTIHFDSITNTYPVQMDIYKFIKIGSEFITIGHQRVYNDDLDFIFEETEQEEFSQYRIYFRNINKPKTYLRVAGITLGAVKIFDNTNIQSCSLTKSIDILSNSLSYQEFKMTINNIDKHYNPIKPSGIYRNFDSNHSLNVEFGRELDDGSIEWVQTAKLITDGKPTFDNYTYTITATDMLTQLTAVNRKCGLPRHTVSPYNDQDYNWILYTLSKNTGWPGGIYEWNVEFKIDNDIDLTETAKIQQPLTKYNEFLQMIANLSCAVLLVDNNGVLRMKNAYLPKITISDNGHLDYSDIYNTINSTVLPTFSYSLLQPDYMETLEPEQQIILPNSLSDITEDRGFISSYISDSTGIFETNPVITIEYSLPINESSIHLVFNNVDSEYAKDFDVSYYNESDTLLYNHVVTNNNQVEYTSAIAVSNVKKILIIIKKWSHRFHRPVINRIGTGRVHNFHLTAKDMFNYPTIKLSGQVKNIVSNYYVLGTDKEVLAPNYTKIFEKTFNEVTNNGKAEINQEVYDVFYKKTPNPDGDVQYYEYGYEFNFMIIKQAPTTCTFYGLPLQKTKLSVTTSYNDKGESYQIDNPMIWNEEMAKKVSDWYYDYVKKGVQVSFDYRGNPELEPFDFIYIETQYEKRVPICVTKTVLEFDGGLKGSVEGVMI